MNNEQTEGAEALAHWILANVPDWLNPVDAREFARDILTSDWLRDREAAAEARGAQAVLADLHDRMGAASDSLYFLAQDADEDRRMAKREGVLLAKGYVYEAIAAARAAAAAAGGGGDFDKALTETRSEYRDALDRLGDR